MPKLPKLTDLTSSMPNVLNKMKSLLDTVTGPGTTEVTEQALAQETDPLKVKFLEVTLLINKLNDIQIIQASAINNLKRTYQDLQKLLGNENAESATDATTSETDEQAGTTHTENKEV